MKSKVVTMILALTLIVSSFVGTSYVDAKKSISGEKITFKVSPYHNELIKASMNGKVDKSKLSTETRKELDEKYKVVSNYLNNLAKKRAKANSLSKKIKSVKDVKIKKELEQEYNFLKSEIFYLDANSNELAGLTKVRTKDKKNTASISYSKDYDSTLETVELYYDNDTGHWALSGSFDWINNYWVEDIGFTNDIGGLDGFYLQISEKVNIYEDGLLLFDYYDGDINSGYPIFSDYDPNGMDWRWQDKLENIVGQDYNSGYGSGHMYFEYYDGTPPAGQTVNFQSGYAHTYSSTDISSISVSTTVAINWNANGTEWKDEANGLFTY